MVKHLELEPVTVLMPGVKSYARIMTSSEFQINDLKRLSRPGRTFLDCAVKSP
jgi:hypothetical protein